MTIKLDASKLTQWNYRIVHFTVPTEDPETGKPGPDMDFYSVHEAYYEPTSIAPECISQTPVGPLGHDLDSWQHDYELIGLAAKHPVVEMHATPAVRTGSIPHGEFRR